MIWSGIDRVKRFPRDSNHQGCSPLGSFSLRSFPNLLSIQDQAFLSTHGFFLLLLTLEGSEDWSKRKKGENEPAPKRWAQQWSG
jgi:hypothetical protein